MARRIRAREALRLRASGLSQNAIARAAHMSKHSVREVLDAAEEAGLRARRDVLPRVLQGQPFKGLLHPAEEGSPPRQAGP